MLPARFPLETVTCARRTIMSGDWHTPTLYAAYGSNLNLAQMRHRCPDAEPVAKVMLSDWRLDFRGVADISPSRGSMLPLGLWSVPSQADRDSLDSYEGFPRHYRRELLNLHYVGGRRLSVVIYRMQAGILRSPNKSYLGSIEAGYNAWQLPSEAIFGALDSAAISDLEGFQE